MNYLVTAIALVCIHSCYGLNLKPYNVTALGMFIGYDYNQDNFFTLDELHRSFTVYDVNHDGRVSRHEYTSYVNTHTPTLHDLSHALYDDYDVDSDHHLDEHDFDNLFSMMDVDMDRRVSEHEWENYWVHVSVRRGHGLAPNLYNLQALCNIYIAIYKI